MPPAKLAEEILKRAHVSSCDSPKKEASRNKVKKQAVFNINPDC
jgi:hypothetical protein